MQTLPERLDYMADHYHLQAPAALLLLGIGIGSSPLLAWTAGLILILETMNKLRHAFVRRA
jgi:hypothetical protein